jgi:hypothetical protein
MFEEIKYNSLDAVKITNGKKDEITVITEVGPRVIGFMPEGRENIFYVNESELRRDAIGDDDWHIYGGTRLWISPEGKASYSPDNSPSDVVSNGKKLTVISPIDKATGLSKCIEIEPLERSFLVTYTIKNEGNYLFTAGLWAISCIKPMKKSVIYLPWGEKGSWNIKDMKYWRSWLHSESNIGSEQYEPANEFFIIRPKGETGKVGFANHWGYTLYCAGELSFIKRSRYYHAAHYPDDGCSSEIYISKNFYEIETLSPLFTTKPGISYSHAEQWWAGFDTIDKSSIKSVDNFINKTLA